MGEFGPEGIHTSGEGTREVLKLNQRAKEIVVFLKERVQDARKMLFQISPGMKEDLEKTSQGKFAINNEWNEKLLEAERLLKQTESISKENAEELRKTIQEFKYYFHPYSGID